MLGPWLSRVFQAIRPLISSKDIRAGSRWPIELAKLLDESQFGILCVTRENMNAPWLLFEAGALSKSLDEGRVIPYLLDLEASDLRGPLSQFQAVVADEKGTRQLVQAIAEAHPLNLRPVELLNDVFSTWWPKLRSQLEELVNRSANHTDVQPSPGSIKSRREEEADLPMDVQKEIESAEAYEAIGDVWSAHRIYASAAEKLEHLSKPALAKEMRRRAKKNASAAAAISRGDR